MLAFLRLTQVETSQCTRDRFMQLQHDNEREQARDQAVTQKQAQGATAFKVKVRMSVKEKTRVNQNILP